MRFSDRICLVTGGGSGIGRAICRRLAAEGAAVLVVDVNEASGADTAAMLAQTGQRALFFKADVSAADQVRSAIAAAIAAFGRVDVLVNNAAVMTFVPIAELPDDEWDRVMAVNLRSVFLLSKYALPQMPAGGTIINVSSVHAHQTTVNVVPYATTKGGIEAFTRGLSRECIGRGIRVNCIDPGAVDTPMLWSNPNVRSGVEKLDGPVGRPEDVAAAVAFLASDEARFINGTSLTVDGGRLDVL